jgi:hypothetical protein
MPLSRYALMLVVMTYNVGLSLAVLAGSIPLFNLHPISLDLLVSRVLMM